MHPRVVVMRDFLIAELKRPLTEQEMQFVIWIANFEQYTFDMAMHLFKEVARKKR